LLSISSIAFNQAKQSSIMKLEIVQAGDPILRKRSRPLTKEEILSPSIQGLISLMRDTMREAPGVGLAAPQIGQSIQLAVIEDRARYIKDVSEEELAKRQRLAIPFHVIINPKLTVVGNSSAVFFEGCLSVEGYQAIVDRALDVRGAAEPVTERVRQLGEPFPGEVGGRRRCEQTLRLRPQLRDP